MNLTRLIKSKNVRNASWIIGGQILQMIINLVISILIARYLGPKSFGELNYTASIVAFFLPFVTLGMDEVIIKEMIENPSDEGTYLGSCIFLRFLSSIISVFLVNFLVNYLNIDDRLKLVLVLLQSVQLFFQSCYIFDSWFQRYLLSKYTSLSKIIASLVVSIYKIVLLVYDKSIVWFAFSNSLMYFVIAILLYLFYRILGGPKLKVSLDVGISVLKKAIILFYRV